MASTREKYLTNAQRYLEKGNLARAIKEYAKVLEIQPDDIRTRLRIGDLQARLGQRNEAISTYEGVAREYSARGFFPKAVAVYKQINRLDPTRSDIQLQLAQLYLQMNLLSESLAQYRQVAEQLRKSGNTEDLADILLQIIDIDPFDVSARIHLGEHCSSQGNALEAAEHFAVAADQLRETNHINEYIKVAERYFFHQPDDVPRLKELVQVYLQREDYKRALAKLQLIFKTTEKDPQALRYLADTFLGLKKRDRAVRVLKELAELHVEKGQEELAVEVYQRVFTLDPDDLDACIHLGLSLPPRYAHRAVSSSQPSSRTTPYPPSLSDQTQPPHRAAPDTGEQWVQTPTAAGLFTYPGNIISLNRLLNPEQLNIIYRLLLEGDNSLKNASWDRGMEVLTQALRIDPDNISARERLVQMYLHQGLVLDAIDQLLHLAGHCWQADPARSSRYLYQALRLDPNHPAANALRHDLGLDQVDLSAFRRETSAPVTGPQEVTSQVKRQEVMAYPQTPGEIPPPTWQTHPGAYDSLQPPSDYARPGSTPPGLLDQERDEITKVSPAADARHRVPPEMTWAKAFSSQRTSAPSDYSPEHGSLSPSPTPHMPGYAPDVATGVYTTSGESVDGSGPVYQAESDLDDLFLDADEIVEADGAVPIEIETPEPSGSVRPSYSDLASAEDSSPSDQPFSDTHPLFGKRRAAPEGVEDVTLPPAASAPTSIVIGAPEEGHPQAAGTPQPPHPEQEAASTPPPPSAPPPVTPTGISAAAPVEKKPEAPRPQVELPPLPDDLPEELKDELTELEILMSSNQRGAAQDLMFEMTMAYPEHTPFIMEIMALLEGQGEK
ncbi:MAG: tetratricopeptide repeat protein [Bradymonadales bacterium]|nr:tetratricopeptide repeat protein [Bradymonadales bacterium]